jgi:hypothetical protein
MQVPAAGLHREILLGPDRVGHRRALERRAEIEAPQLLERLILIGDDPAVLRGGEHDPAGRDQRAGADLDIGDRLRQDLVVDGVVGGDGAVIKVAGEGALLAGLGIDAAVGPLERDLGAVLREAALGADPVGDVLDRIVGGRLVGDAAVSSLGSYSTGLPVLGSRPLVQFKSLTYCEPLMKLPLPRSSE